MQLAWNTAGDRTFEAGVDRGVFYPSAGEPAVWNGLIAVNEQPSGSEAQSYYLDGIKFMDFAGAEDFAGTIEAYATPKNFELYSGQDYLGSVLIADNQPKRPFGLSYRTRIGNDLRGTEFGYKIHLVYNVTLGVSESAYATLGEETEPLVMSWPFSTIPEEVSGLRPTAHFVVDTRTVDQQAVAVLEGYLYGSENVNPRMPSPPQVADFLGGWEHLTIARPITFRGSQTAADMDSFTNLARNPSFEATLGQTFEGEIALIGDSLIEGMMYTSTFGDTVGQKTLNYGTTPTRYWIPPTTDPQVVYSVSNYNYGDADWTYNGVPFSFFIEAEDRIRWPLNSPARVEVYFRRSDGSAWHTETVVGTPQNGTPVIYSGAQQDPVWYIEKVVVDNPGEWIELSCDTQRIEALGVRVFNSLGAGGLGLYAFGISGLATGFFKEEIHRWKVWSNLIERLGITTVVSELMTNDAIQSVPPATFRNNMNDAMVELADKNITDFRVVALPNVGFHNLTAYNAELPNTNASEIIDATAMPLDGTTVGPDGTHWTPAGNQAFANILYNALRNSSPSLLPKHVTEDVYAEVEVSDTWSNSGLQSMKVTPTDANPFSIVQVAGSVDSLEGLGVEFEQDETYTIVGVCHLESVQTGTLHSNPRSLCVRKGNGSGTYTYSASAPNTIGSHTVRYEFQVGPADDRCAIYLVNGAAENGGDVWWDDLTIVKGSYDGPPFNPFSENLIYQGSQVFPTWDATVGDSSSTFVAATGLPESPRNGDAWLLGGTFWVFTNGVWTNYGPLTVDL